MTVIHVICGNLKAIYLLLYIYDIVNTEGTPMKTNWDQIVAKGYRIHRALTLLHSLGYRDATWKRIDARREHYRKLNGG